jgi:hypothetical protein
MPLGIMLVFFTVGGSGLHVVRTLSNDGKVASLRNPLIEAPTPYSRSLGSNDDGSRQEVDGNTASAKIMANCARGVQDKFDICGTSVPPMRTLTMVGGTNHTSTIKRMEMLIEGRAIAILDLRTPKKIARQLSIL